MDPWRLSILCIASLLVVKSIAGLFITNCWKGTLPVVEGTDTSFSCSGHTSNVDWTVYDIKRQILYSASCNGQTCTPVHNQFILNVDTTSSSLKISSITRDSVRTISCSNTWTATECNITIIVPVRLVPESCSVQQVPGWNMSGLCVIEWLDGVDRPTCTWRLNEMQEFGRFQGSITSTINDNITYIRQSCYFNRKLPVIDGKYTYSIGVSSHPADLFSKTLPIEKPDIPKYNCPENILEGSNVNCTCYASKIGNPPAHIAWNGSKNENFIMKNITRKSNGTLGICSLM